MKQLVQLQQNLPRLNDAGIQVIGISYDSAEVMREFAKKRGVQFPLLSDPSSRTIERYHVRNEQVKSKSRQDGIPHPGTFVLDSKGVVRGKLFYTVVKRHGPDELIEVAESIR